METIDLLSDDLDIDVPISDRDEDERHVLRLANALRLVADHDPQVALRLVDQLIISLDKALDGRFRDYLDGSAREAVSRILDTKRDLRNAPVSSIRNS